MERSSLIWASFLFSFFLMDFIEIWTEGLGFIMKEAQKAKFWIRTLRDWEYMLEDVMGFRKNENACYFLRGLT